MLLIKRFFEMLTKNKLDPTVNKSDKLFARGRGYREELYTSRRFDVKHGNLSQALKQLNVALNEGILVRFLL
jgi:hypothetical protein